MCPALTYSAKLRPPKATVWRQRVSPFVVATVPSTTAGVAFEVVSTSANGRLVDAEIGMTISR
jgi:hypothetical protein